MPHDADAAGTGHSPSDNIHGTADSSGIMGLL